MLRSAASSQKIKLITIISPRAQSARFCSRNDVDRLVQLFPSFRFFFFFHPVVAAKSYCAVCGAGGPMPNNVVGWR